MRERDETSSVTLNANAPTSSSVLGPSSRVSVATLPPRPTALKAGATQQRLDPTIAASPARLSRLFEKIGSGDIGSAEALPGEIAEGELASRDIDQHEVASCPAFTLVSHTCSSFAHIARKFESRH